MKEPKLHELLAVEGDLEGVFKSILQETLVTLTKRDDHFMGFHRKLELFDDEAQEQPEEFKELVTTVQQRMDYQSNHAIRFFDAVLQKDMTNQLAVADIVIDGVVIAEEVPATFLLGLEKKLKVVRETYDAIPTLAPGQKWELDEAKGPHIYSLTHPEETMRTANVPAVQVLYAHTDKHPAQIEKFMETKDIGRYTKNIWSGMVTPAEKSRLLGKVDALIQAVKKARQRANTTDVVIKNIGQKLFDFINS